MRRIIVAALITGLAVALAACPAEPDQDPRHIPPEAIGEVERGRELFAAYGCASCHSVSGMRVAQSEAAPSLDGFAGQRLIAGSLHNEPQALIRWIVDPQQEVPGTLMPSTGVSPQDAADIAAFLYTLD